MINRDPLHVLQSVEDTHFYRSERKTWIWPRLTCYRVAEPKTVKFVLNRYPHHVVGAAVVIGRYSLGVRWARLGSRRR